MKFKHTIFLLLYFLYTGIPTISFAQLTPGDIAFVGFNSQNPDAFSIVTLTNLIEGEVIYFTDNGWLSSGNLRSGEGTIEWTIPTGGISKGTIILFENNPDWHASSGTVTGGITLASSADQILAYTGDETNPNFIAAIQFAGNGWDSDATSTSTSALPAGLTNDSTAVALPETENALYCGTYSGIKTEELIQINNPDRWHSNNSQRLNLSPELYPFEAFSNTAGTNDWNTATNWLTYSLPNQDISVIIPNDKIAQIIGLPTAYCKNLFIEPEGFLILASGNTLNVSNNLIIQSYSITKTGGISSNGNLNVNGSSTVERYMYGDCWHIISSPVKNQTLGSFAGNPANLIQLNSTYNDFDLAPYDETIDEWNPYTTDLNSSLIETGKGYVVRRTETGNVSFTGDLNLSDTTITLTRNNHGWNCVGNPFPSAIIGTGTGSFLATNSQHLDSAYAALYIWDEDPGKVGDYITYTSASSQKLAIGQGFIVKSKSDGEVITFTNSMTVQSAPSFKSQQTEPVFIKLTATTNNFTNSTEIYFNSNMTTGLDPTFDAGKLKGNPDFSLYTKLINGNNLDYAVQAIPFPETEDYRIPIGLNYKNGGEITFTANSENLPANLPLILEDIKTNTLIYLNENDAIYSTFIDSDEAEIGRFFLLTNENMATQSKIIEENVFKVKCIQKTIIIEGITDNKTQFKLFGIDGKIHAIRKGNSSNINRININPFPAGIYLLKIEGPKQIQTTKIIISD